MKRKISGLIILIIISVSCLFAFLGTGASASSAESAVAPYVLSKNISYDSIIYCYYAVPKDSVPAGEEPMLEVYSSEGGELLYTVSEYYEETVHAIPCYIFSTKGVSPKNLSFREYVVPISVGASGKTVGSGVEYGVLEYLYERLYRNGFIKMTEADGDDYTRKQLYFALMNYGQSAQNVLIPGQVSSGKVQPVYGDYNYTSVSRGLNYGFVDKGYTVELSPLTVPVPQGYEVTGWIIRTYDVRGNLLNTETVSASYALSADGIKIAEPIYTGKNEVSDPNTVRFDSISNPNVTLGTSNSDATHTIVDGALVSKPGDNVLKVEKTSGAASVKIKIPTADIDPGAQKAVFSIDMMMTNLSQKGNVEIYFRKAGYDSQSYSPILIILTPEGLEDGSGITYNDYTNASRNEKTLSLGTQVGEWFNITIEYYEGDADTFHYITYINGEMKYISNAIYGKNLYVDGVLPEENIPTAEQMNTVHVNINSSQHGCMYFDNMSLTYENTESFGDGHIENLPAGQTAYNSSCNVMVISESTTAAVSSANTLVNALKSNVTSGAFFGYETYSRANEIIIGDVPSREVSVKAYEELEKLSSSSMFTQSRYVIYADGGRIAFAYDKNTQTNIQSITYAVKEFISKYVDGKSGIILGKGVIASGTFDLIEKQEEIDAKTVEQAWELLRVQCNNDELYEAFRTYYKMFENDKVVEWMANLYDPGFGCFYATTSGKNSPNIYPNIEATRQVLTLSSSLGMTKNIGETNAFTPLMEYQICYYIKSLQHENGYFYLPQLTKAQTDSAIARRARDLNWCVQLLSLYRVAPTYEAPITYGGLLEPDGKTADEYWADLVAKGLVSWEDKPVIWKVVDTSVNLLASAEPQTVKSVVKLTSAVVVSDDDGTAYLKSHAAFAEYIAGLNIDGDPYTDGNELGESQRQINEWSGKLGRATESGVWYSGMTLNEMIIHHLNSCINEKGLFGKKYLTDNNASTVGNEFVNTNGMMKIMAVYNGLEVAFPSEWAPIAAESLLNAVMRTDQVSKTNICEMYNIWCALSRLKTNVKSYNSDISVRDNVLAQIEDLLNTNGAAAVLNAYNTQKNYQKEDGTYAHRVQGLGSVTTHPGNLIVGTGGEEGNIDAIGFGTISTINMICDAFNFTPVPIYTEADWMRFLDIVMKLEPTGKTVALRNQFLDYESDDGSGMLIKNESNFEENSIEIVNKTGLDGNPSYVLEMVKGVTGSGSNVSSTFLLNSASKANVLVFETDMMFSAGSSGPVEIWLRRGDNNPTSPHFAYISISSGKVYVQSNAGGTKHQIASLGSWFKLRMEYRVTAVDASGKPQAFEIKLLVNDSLVYTETALYSGFKEDIPSPTKMTRVSVGLSQSMTGKCYLDNTTAILDNED